MSFSAMLKTEILENRPMRSRYKKAQAYGLFMFSKSFTKSSVLMATENPALQKLFISFIRDFIGKNTQTTSNEKSQNGKTVYTTSLAEAGNRARLLEFFGQTGRINMEILREQGHIYAFLSGAYLACGNITDPTKSYHIEFVVKDEDMCDELKALLDACLPGSKKTARRGGFVLYYKEYSQIEDLLTLMGATKSCLAMIDIEMIKGARNNANRATNCETANIDKMVDAARSQIDDIKLIFKHFGREALPERLKEIAEIRLDNPDLSLRELGELLSPPLSRSGVYHRLDRLSALAKDLREAAGK